MTDDTELRYIRRDLDEARKESKRGFERVHDDIATMRALIMQNYVPREEYKKDLANIKQELDSNKSNVTWIVRLIISTVVLALLGLVIKVGV